MINWQLLVDEELRENVLRHVDKCEVWDLWIDAGWMPIVEDIFCLNTNEGRHPDFVVQEPSAQEIIDAVVEETRDVEEWKKVPRDIAEIPEICPKCKSPYWKTAKKIFRKGEKRNGKY